LREKSSRDTKVSGERDKFDFVIFVCCFFYFKSISSSEPSATEIIRLSDENLLHEGTALSTLTAIFFSSLEVGQSGIIPFLLLSSLLTLNGLLW
jgi:hypothetical protein